MCDGINVASHCAQTLFAKPVIKMVNTKIKFFITFNYYRSIFHFQFIHCCGAISFKWTHRSVCQNGDVAVSSKWTHRSVLQMETSQCPPNGDVAVRRLYGTAVVQLK